MQHIINYSVLTFSAAIYVKFWSVTSGIALIIIIPNFYTYYVQDSEIKSHKQSERILLKSCTGECKSLTKQINRITNEYEIYVPTVRKCNSLIVIYCEWLCKTALFPSLTELQLVDLRCDGLLFCTRHTTDVVTSSLLFLREISDEFGHDDMSDVGYTVLTGPARMIFGVVAQHARLPRDRYNQFTNSGRRKLGRRDEQCNYAPRTPLISW